MEVPEGNQKEQGIKILFENIIMENFPNLLKKADMQIQEAQRVPSKTFLIFGILIMNTLLIIIIIKNTKKNLLVV